ncbi:MAG TPA: Gfo/Idh/MocA family oxidoreductase [Bryobacteraceae bacterium]|jgi:predicted dehydrogenase|nr:Gfo/Idh/MocA family oxidoreductase [Bryobacteraceae bacterium]
MRVTVFGGGMITHDQILPSVYQLQRLGLVDEIAICARHDQTLRVLSDSPQLKVAFPGQAFRSNVGPYRDALRATPPRNVAVIALPDHLHFDAVMAALEADQHVLVVKPLVMKLEEAETIEREALRRDLFVGVEYHKRFDDRSLMARRKYRAGEFGEFRLGSACLMEKWYYRHSNFQNWCTTENSDAFAYIGCHYVDLVHFITGLSPVSVSVYGVKDEYPNGNEGFLWTDARIIWSNGACLNVQNSLSFPDDAPGTNTQGLTLYCASRTNGALIRHSDQYRGVEHVYTTRPEAPGATIYAEPSPDYFQYVDLGNGGLTPVGYGYRSIEYLFRCCLRVENAPDRQQAIRGIDREAIVATPANSSYNEQVIEAARRSIRNGGAPVSVSSGTRTAQK